MPDFDPDLNRSEDSLDRNGKVRQNAAGPVFNPGQFRLLSEDELETLDQAPHQEHVTTQQDSDLDIAGEGDYANPVEFVVTSVQPTNLKANRKIDTNPSDSVKIARETVAKPALTQGKPGIGLPSEKVDQVPVEDRREERNGPAVMWAIWDNPISRICAYLILVFIFSGILGLCLYPATGYLFAHRRLQSDLGYVTEALSALAAFWIMVTQAEHRRLSEAGFSNERAPTRLVLGLMLGAASAGILFAVLIAISVCDPGKINTNASLFAPLAMCIVIATAEEVIFRGYILRIIENRFGSLLGIVLSCALFGLLHYVGTSGQTIPNGERVLGPLCIAIGEGSAFAAAYVATRSLWMPIGLHFACAFVVGPIFGVNVAGAADGGNSLFNSTLRGEFWLTGGSFGPEASIPAVIIFLLLTALLLNSAVRHGKWRKYGVWEPASLPTEAAPVDKVK